MRYSQTFIKTSKTAPADEVAKNAQLLIRAGFVYKEMAGVYAYLPLGLRVLEKIKQIVREELATINSSELTMTTLQRASIWQAAGRWSDEVVDIWFKTKLQDETELGLGWSHEEPIVEMLKGRVASYKDLPISVYQFQTKLRNELRAKSGVMRGREFLMKDMYSFHSSSEDLENYYQQTIEVYQRIYHRLGIGEGTFVTFASGGSFTKFSHEFQTVCEAGEDVIYLHRERKLAINEEVVDEAVAELGLNRDELEKVKTAEVGNIFNFGSQKTDQMGLKFTNQEGKLNSIFMGSYGIGVSRLMGVLAEKFSDDKGLIWPLEVAPVQVYLVQIGDQIKDKAEEIYQALLQAGIEVLFDDREVRPGQKFADAELMGIPYRLTVGQRAVESGEFELTERQSGETKLLTVDSAIDKIKQRMNS